MKKLFAFSLIGSSLLFSAQHTKADWDFWAIDSGGYRAIDDTTLNRILTVNSVTGEKTVRHVIQDGGAFQISHIDENSGNLVLKGGNYLYEYEELTLLHKVSSRGFSDFVKLLLEKGADLDCRSKSGETPLYLAAWHGQVEVVKLLLEAGADKISINLSGTPYSVAYRKGYYEICELLK